MAFEVFDKRNSPMRGMPSVTIQKRGLVSINGPAHEIIERALTVELLFDKDRQIMAIRPSERSSRSYELRKPTKTGQTVLSGAAFVETYGIDTTVSRRYEPFREDGMLCIDLNGPSAVVRGNRSKNSSAPEPGAE